jgi:hypothetical protein
MENLFEIMIQWPKQLLIVAWNTSWFHVVDTLQKIGKIDATTESPFSLGGKE